VRISVSSANIDDVLSNLRMLPVTQIRWLLIGALAVLLFAMAMSEQVTVGVSRESTDTSYRFAGGTQPWALAGSVVIILLYFLLIYAPPTSPNKPLPGVFRRFIAFWVDFVLSILAVAPVIGLVATMREWRLTGTFQWTFERNVPVRGDDALAATGFVVAAVALLFYFAWPLVRSKPSPGACIVGYQVLPEGDKSITWGKALWRTLLGFVAMAVWYLAPFLARDRKKGQFWLDKVFHTRAVLLK
jgi:RDD family